MVAIVTSSHGKDSLQVLQRPGSKIVSIATTMELATMADLHLLRGQLAIVVAIVTAATVAIVVLLAAVLLHGNNRLLRHRLPLVKLAMVMVHIPDTIKALAMDHLRQQPPRGSALSCSNTLVHHRLRQVMALHHLHRLPLVGNGGMDSSGKIESSTEEFSFGSCQCFPWLFRFVFCVQSESMYF